MTAERDEIVAGLKRWAIGSYPDQVAVEFLAGTNEPLTRIWVRRSDRADEGRYWLDWDMFDGYGGGLSGGERRTWALARSLCEGELRELLWGIDDARIDSLLAAIARRTTDWPR